MYESLISLHYLVSPIFFDTLAVFSVVSVFATIKVFL